MKKKAAAKKTPKKKATKAVKAAAKKVKKAPKPKPAPPCVTPYLVVKGATAAINFYKQIFKAKEKYRLSAPDGHIGHAELTIGKSEIFLADEAPMAGSLAPPTVGGTPVQLHLEIPNVDDVIARAVAAGATVLRPAADQFYGDRAGVIADPFGHRWYLATRGKRLSPKAMQKKFNEMVSQQPAIEAN